MDVVELGGARLHLLAAYPGLPGEADRLVRSLARLAPAIVLGDLDTEDALRARSALSEKKPFEAGFVDGLFRAEAHRRFAPDVAPGEHPLAAAVRYARDRRADFVPLRPSAPRPGFLARRRLLRAARHVDADSPQDFAHRFGEALAEAGVWSAEREVATAHKRLVRQLSDGRAPVVAVVQAHRQAAYEDAVLLTERIPA